MSVKKIVKKCVPKSYIYDREYRLHDGKNAKKTYAEIEQEINAKYEEKFSRKIDWDNPKTYNEKLNVAKVYGATAVKTRLTDKLLAAEWVKERVGDECKIIPLIATYDSVDEIDFDKLPERYVMKMNSDSGSVFIRDEEHPVTKTLIAKYKYYFQKRNYAYTDYEMHYKDIKPRIMIEKYMGGAIRDYKFQCFDGKVLYCWVDSDRFGKHTRNFYDRNWNLLSLNNGKLENYHEPIEKPVNFEKMWHLAERLSRGFDQVRVDFYDIDGDVYFGEMTFTSASGFKPFRPDEADYKIGALWKLDMESIRKRRRELLDNGARIGD